MTDVSGYAKGDQHAFADVRHKADKLRAAAALAKPFDLDELVNAILAAVSDREGDPEGASTPQQ